MKFSKEKKTKKFFKEQFNFNENSKQKKTNQEQPPKSGFFKEKFGNQKPEFTSNEVKKTLKTKYKGKEYIAHSFSGSPITFTPWIYDVFLTEKKSDLNQFKISYRKLALKHHPDKVPNSPRKQDIASENIKFYNALYGFIKESFEDN